MPFIGTWRVWFGFALLCPSPPPPAPAPIAQNHILLKVWEPSSILASQDLPHSSGGGRGAGGGGGVGLDVSFGWTYSLWEIIASGLLPDSNQSCPAFFQVGGTSVSAYSHGWLKYHPVSFWLEKHLSKAAFRNRKDEGILADRYWPTGRCNRP